MTNYTYNEDTKIELTGQQFELIQIALMQGIDSTTQRSFPEKRMFVDTETGKEVKSPSTDQIKSGKVVEQVDIEGTFQVPTVSYNDKLTPHMINASLLVNAIHQENIQKGIAVPVVEDKEQGAE